jgi:hypothetical protein
MHLIEQMDRDMELVNRPAHSEKEIEVTPEVIEAGADTLSIYFDSPMVVLRRVAYECFANMVAKGPIPPGAIS